jgi:predicted signal transduction protein with EAL and GGDEF domain/CheY-like chemotaxis protein
MNFFDPENPDEARPPKVLLVDDDEVNLLLISVALREHGFQVTEANSGSRALQLLTEQMPDVVVLDALMPGRDGFETCRELRAMPGFESLPVLMLTGLEDEASIARAYETGATDFFVKSNHWSLLAGRLRYLLRASRTRSELERSKAKLARAQDLARMGSFDWPTGRCAPIFSTEAMRAVGLSFQPTLTQIIRMIRRPERKAFIAKLREAMMISTVVTFDVNVKLPDDRPRIMHVEAEPTFRDQGFLHAYIGIVQDVTERRNAEDKIRHLANFDTLTGLPNRRQFIWRSERALEHARRLGHEVSMLMIDLDRFKIVNDTLGHGAGDELLVEVSRRLRRCVRHSDQVVDHHSEPMGVRAHRTLEAVARLGGDEFVTLLPEVTGEAEAKRVAERMLHALREPIIVGGQECFVTASVGLSLFPRDGNSVADLMRNADVAMYVSKAGGRNLSSAFRPHLAGKGREKLELESALHKAIERNELVLHYQPKIDVRASKMVGVEALMRWRRGNTLVAPGDFIPLAEETGLIVPMSDWAIREASRQAREWSSTIGFAEMIAVNMPSRLFESNDIVDQIQCAVDSCGINQRFIELEITETGLMKDIATVVPVLQRLKDRGVQISIDDFGTGYSSLAYLTALPISELKIDRSFVNNLGNSVQSAAVVSAIIALARSLSLRVVAEGVETLEQMETLHRLGCHTMQGFLFCKPLPAEKIKDWLEQSVLPRKAPWIRAAQSLMTESLVHGGPLSPFVQPPAV